MSTTDHWPREGLVPSSASELEADIAKLRTPYSETPPPFSYPGMLPHPTLRDGLARIAAMSTDKHINAIGMHTTGHAGEGGFKKLQDMERTAIGMAASVIGGSLETVDGYFASGGTEANEWGLWIGREWLEHNVHSEKGTVVLMTPLTHYSVPKVLSKLNIAKMKATRCETCHKAHVTEPDPSGAGVSLVGMDSEGRMLVDDLRRLLTQKVEQGFKRIIVVANVGTTAFGSVDPIDAICDVVDDIESHSEARVYIHIDAAFGGFTVPFLAPETAQWFARKQVMSVTMDGHKMGHLSYPGGIALCRKGLASSIARHVEYINGHEDNTVCGSRSATPAMMAFYAWRTLGFEGQARFVRECVAKRDALCRLIEAHIPNEHAAIRSVPNAVNQLGLQVRTPKIGEHPRLAPYGPRFDLFPSVPSQVSSCPVSVYKILVMPHTFPYLEDFVQDLMVALAETQP